MTDKARTLSLMALKQKAQIAETLTEVGKLARQKAEAEAMTERLDAMLAQRREGATGPRLATDLMAERRLTGQLLTEAERQRERWATLAADLVRHQAELSQQEHRLQTLGEKAQAARTEAAQEKQARIDAAQPPRKR
jgi:hypothetical protein